MNKLRKIVLASNWKMNLLPEDSKIYVKNLCELIENISSKIDVHIYVPYIDIHTAIKYSKNSRLKVGAQNCHFEVSGAFTGEISTDMLLSLEIRNVIIGHSERRKYFCETDEIINKKIKKVLNDDMSVILCVGETLEEKNAGIELSIVESQITKGLETVDDMNVNNICIAYEPVWAIGTGKNATPLETNEMCKHIRKTIKKIYSEKISDAIQILYGGSLNSENVENIIVQSDIDGGLIGGASLKADKFYEIINKVDKIIKKEDNNRK